jgi:ribosomal-protein-alanine N-acetyltransferase
MKLRPATGEDAAALAAVHASCFEAPWSAADLAALTASPGHIALLVEDDRPRGFILARALAGEAEVLTLAVDPAARRRGAGRALLAAALGQAEALGAATVFLEVAKDNAPALALYGGCGFEAAGARKGYYPRPGGAADAMVLRRTLNRAAG